MKYYHKALSGFAQIKQVNLIPVIDQYQDLINQRLKSRGKKDMIAFSKSLLSYGERYALHQDVEPIPWTRSDKDGFPYCISLMKPLLRGEPMEAVLALSVLRTVEMFRNPISKDIGSVINPPSGKMTHLQDILEFIPVWLKRLSISIDLPEMDYHMSMKNGPNGPALSTSGTDVTALKSDKLLMDSITTVQEILCDPSPMTREFTESKSDQPIHSKLTQFPEKSGKTRTIAVVDYYSQRCLRPLHKGLMKILANLKTDGTYSHRHVGKFAQTATADKADVVCADLTAATDRFPAIIQKALLTELIKDNRLSNSLYNLLAKRVFTVAWSGEKVTYEVGQPMGAYASWPLFALSHHLVVEYCAHKARVPRVSKLYRLIGDDVIIKSQKLGQYYLSVMKDLGLEINYDKTVISKQKDSYSAAEVAKQLFLNGNNLTPLTPGAIANLKSPHLINFQMKEIMDRYALDAEAPAVLFELFFPISQGSKKREQALLNLCNPWNGSMMLSKEVSGTPNPWAQVDRNEFLTTFYNVRRDLLAAKAENLMMSVFSSEIPETYEKGRLRPDGNPQTEAEYYAEMQLRCDLEKALYGMPFDQMIKDYPDSFMPVEYIANPLDVQFVPTKVARRIHETTVINEVYTLLSYKLNK